MSQGASYEWEKSIQSLAKDYERRPRGSSRERTQEISVSGPGTYEGIAARIKVVEDELKRLQRSQRTVMDIVLKMDHHIRIEVSQREEKLMSQMRKEIEDLKAYVDSQNSNMSKEKYISPAKKIDIDTEVINSYVSSKVKDLFTAKIETLSSDVLSCKAKLLAAEGEAQSREEAMLNKFLATSSNNEKDAQRLRSELLRMKGRCDLLEDAVRELSSGRQTHEQTMEETCRRTLSTCRSDMRQIADSMTKRVSEAIDQGNEKNSQRLKQFETQSKSMRGKVKELLVWKGKTDQQLALSEQVIVGIFSQLKQIQDDVRLTHDQVSKVPEMGEDLADTRKVVVSLEESVKAQDFSLREVQQSLLGIQSAEAAIQAETAALKLSNEALTREQTALMTAVQNLESWGLQTRDKLRELSGSIKEYAIRSGSERISSEVEDKVEKSPSSTYSEQPTHDTSQDVVISNLLSELLRKKKEYRSALKEKLYSKSQPEEKAGDT